MRLKITIPQTGPDVVLADSSPDPSQGPSIVSTNWERLGAVLTGAGWEERCEVDRENVGHSVTFRTFRSFATCEAALAARLDPEVAFAIPADYDEIKFEVGDPVLSTITLSEARVSDITTTEHKGKSFVAIVTVRGGKMATA